MSNVDRIIVAGVKLRADRPTTVTLDELFGWVIWQFPHAQDKGYCGAVRPPSEHEWLPALIQPEKNRVRVYWNVGQTYPTPEKAADFFMRNEQG